jgi:hypothetical protein
MNQVGNAVAPGAAQAASTAAEMAPSFLGSLGSMATDAATSSVGKMVIPEMLKAGYGEMQVQGYNQQARKNEQQLAQMSRAFNDGGLATLKGGGSIKMVDGQYVVSADVVSALGNGSSKAGAKFLQEAFNQIRAQGAKKPAKPPKRAGALAEQRMLERARKKRAA